MEVRNVSFSKNFAHVLNGTTLVVFWYYHCVFMLYASSLLNHTTHYLGLKVRFQIKSNRVIIWMTTLLFYAINVLEKKVLIELVVAHAFTYRNSRPEVFLEKGVLEICSKFKGEHLCLSVISIKFQSNFIEITLRHGCFPVNLLHVFRIPFPKNTSGRLLLNITVL